ncbi:hypothetical protein LCGC14_2065820 [marine sediment metagenome]|uniref:Uncharacterized protein n=1 Tax=marine sediment metagenome TaxID=412755 RepID=A0A0F9GYD0_9ZZZZ
MQETTSLKVWLWGGVALIGIAAACIASIPFLDAPKTWMEVTFILGIFAIIGVVTIAALALIGYPLAKADADVRRCNGCKDEKKDEAA